MKDDALKACDELAQCGDSTFFHNRVTAVRDAIERMAASLQRARHERDEAVRERQRLQVSLDLLDDTVRQKVAENARQFKQIEELHEALDKATAQVAKLGDKLITAAREGRKNDL